MLRKILNVKKAWFFLGLFAFVSSLSMAAHAQSRDVSSRLSRIENEIQTLNRAVYRGEKPPVSALSGGDAQSNAAAEVRLQQLELELRDIRGKIEEQSYQIRQMSEKLERSLGDIELRMNDVEGRKNGASDYNSPVNPASLKDLQRMGDVPRGASETAEEARDNFTWSSNPSNSSTQTLGSVSRSGGDSDQAAASYENAFSLLKNSNYEAAGKGFDIFIRENPDHALVGNAKYWLGETYYVRGDYETAARIFAEGYQQFPKGTKAADNLLKLGMSLAATGAKDNACVAFSQLKKDFSSGSDPVLRRAEQEMGKAGCS